MDHVNQRLQGYRDLINELGDQSRAEAARMSLPEKLEDVHIDAIRDELAEHRSQFSTPIAQIAKDCNIAEATLRDFMKGRTKTSTEDIARQVNAWLLDQRASKQLAAPGKIVSTRVASEILGVLKDTRDSHRIGILVGDGGIGKSVTLRTACRVKYPGSPYVELPRGVTRKDLLVLIAEAVGGVPTSGSATRVLSKLVAKMKTMRNKVLVIDQAHQLTEDLVQVVVDLHKLACHESPGCPPLNFPILLCGSVDIHDIINDSTQAKGQTYRCLGVVYDITQRSIDDGRPLYSEDEVARYIDAMGLRITRAGLERLTDVANIPGLGRLGTVSHIAKIAADFWRSANKNSAGTPVIGITHIDASIKQRSGTAMHERIDALREQVQHKMRKVG